MININVKNVQNGEVVSKIKEVDKVYVTFIKYDEADHSISNIDLQQRLNPLANINVNIEPNDGSFVDANENVNLQSTLYPKTNLIYPTDSHAELHKVTQIWAFVNNDIRRLFSLITSCFGSGIWMSEEKWSDTELWKY